MTRWKIELSSGYYFRTMILVQIVIFYRIEANAVVDVSSSRVRDIQLSPAEFLLETDPNLAHYAGGQNAILNTLFGSKKQKDITKEKDSGKLTTSNQIVEESGESLEIGDELDLKKNAEAFAISTGSVRFYGGLLTFGHELHPARICRVLNACIRNDGTVVLPSWMRRYDEMLSFDCGIRKLEFSLTDTNPPPPLHNLDLFGSEVPPSELHGFVASFAPQLVALDLIAGERDLTQQCHSRLGKGCFGFPLESSIRPAVLIHPEIKSQSARSSWIKQFIELIPVENYKHKVRMLSQNELFSMQSEDEVQCFRSAILTRSPRTKYSINPDMLRELSIFKRNNISKSARVVRTKIRASERFKKCRINIMFINRKKPTINGTLPQAVGFIPNIWRLRKEIKSRAIKFKNQGLRVNVSALTLDNKRLRYQMNAMQKSDIVISGSTGYLANMLFMRENSTIIELMAFGYYPKYYEKLARFTANVRYDSYIAHPDVKGFRNCIKAIVPENHANHTKAMRVVRRFKRVANNYLISDNTHSYTLHNLRRDLDFVKPCARSQRLNSNATLFATQIIHHARTRCGISLAKLEDADV